MVQYRVRECFRNLHYVPRPSALDGMSSTELCCGVCPHICPRNISRRFSLSHDYWVRCIGSLWSITTMSIATICNKAMC